MPEVPSPSHSPPSPVLGRRTFLSWLTYAMGAVATALVAIPFLGYLFGALRMRRVAWVPLGQSSDFPLNETRLATFENPLGQPWDGMADRMGVYVRKQSADQFLVFAMNCAHLGCPVTWFPQSGLFLCPCHGGVYYENGQRAAGPPPRGLFHCVWRVRDGQLEIQAPHLPTLQNTLGGKSQEPHGKSQEPNPKDQIGEPKNQNPKPKHDNPRTKTQEPNPTDAMSLGI